MEKNQAFIRTLAKVNLVQSVNILMHSISVKEFFLWEKKQINKGGNKQSLSLLIDLVGGIPQDKLNLLRINSEGNLLLKKKLDLLESIWENHIFNLVPIQYLIGFTFWRDLKLSVSEKVLIPRPETEFLIDIILEIFKKNSQKLFFAELGTGSGAISISLAIRNPLWEGIATDIDKNAIKIAAKNFTFCSSQKNLKFTCGHWWNPLENFRGKLDFVVSNPPYIPNKIYKRLPAEVKNFEPKIALVGGEDGLLHIREIIHNAPQYLKEKGWLILENHFDHGAKVMQLLIDNKFTSVKVLKDFSGIGRFTIGRYN